MKKIGGWILLAVLMGSLSLFAGFKIVERMREERIDQFVADKEALLAKQGRVKIQTGNTGSTFVLAALPTDGKGESAKELEEQILAFTESQLGAAAPSGQIERIALVETEEGTTPLKGITTRSLRLTTYQVDWFSIREGKKAQGPLLYVTKDLNRFTLLDLLPNESGARTIIQTVLREQLTQAGVAVADVDGLLAPYEELDLRAQDFTYTEGQLSLPLATKPAGLTDLILPLPALYSVLESSYLSDTDKKAYDDYLAQQAIDKKALRQVALTFDDGPNPATTPQILDLLKRYKVKATFFVLGQQVAGNEALLKRMAAEGHEVANHTFTHPNLTTLSPDQVKEEIGQTQAAIQKVLGTAPVLMRPPYGAVNQSVVDAMGLPSIYWSVDSEDWSNRNPQLITQIIQAQTQPGSIILMHDIHQPTVEALEPVLAFLTGEGYNLVTTSELLGKNLNPQLIYYDQEAAGPASH